MSGVIFSFHTLFYPVMGRLLGFSLKVYEKTFHSFAKNMYKSNVTMKLFYAKTMESLLFIII